MRILIAEDEPPVARAIAAMVRGCMPGATILGPVHDGQAAIELIDREVPDLVLTDIHMPVKSGVEVIRQCGRMARPPLMVVISGYREFEYAREALSYGAVDYLLKPLDPEEFERCLERSVQRLAARDRGGPSRLVLQLGPRCQLAFPTDSLRFPLDALCVAASNLSRAGLGMPPSPSPLAFPCPSSPLPSCAPAQAYLETCGASMRLALFTLAEPQSSSARKLEDFLELESGRAPSPTTIARASGIRDLAGLEEALPRLVEGCLDRGVLGARQILPESGEEEGEEAERPALELIDESALLTAMRASGSDGARSLSETLCAMMRRSGARSGEVAACLSRLAASSCRLAEGLGAGAVPVRLRLDFEERMMAALNASHDYGALRPRLEEVLASLFGELELKSSHYHGLVETVERYLESSLDRQVTVKGIAGYLGQDPDSVSRSFKKATGRGLSRSITAFKMRKAQEKIRDFPELLVRDIALAVGYEDPLYFSRVFKAETGKWPSEYQEERRKLQPGSEPGSEAATSGSRDPRPAPPSPRRGP